MLRDLPPEISSSRNVSPPQGRKWYGGHDAKESIYRSADHRAKVIDQIAADLSREFPTLQGFSPRNLKYMRAFAEAWPDEPIVQEALAQLPWSHQIALLEKLKTKAERLAYAAAAVEHGWSRGILVIQIESGYLKRLGKASNNFARTLSPAQSDLAGQTLKDPHLFDFLELTGDVNERRLERAFFDHIRSFLLELGVGFAFVGHQVHLEVAGEDFYLDMLFYHVRLHCYVVVELKAIEFRPEFAGKMQFYLSAVDDLGRDRKKGRADHRPAPVQEQEARHRRVHTPRGPAPHRRRQLPADTRSA